MLNITCLCNSSCIPIQNECIFLVAWSSYMELIILCVSPCMHFLLRGVLGEENMKPLCIQSANAHFIRLSVVSVLTRLTSSSLCPVGLWWLDVFILYREELDGSCSTKLIFPTWNVFPTLIPTFENLRSYTCKQVYWKICFMLLWKKLSCQAPSSRPLFVPFYFFSLSSSSSWVT